MLIRSIVWFLSDRAFKDTGGCRTSDVASVKFMTQSRTISAISAECYLYLLIPLLLNYINIGRYQYWADISMQPCLRHSNVTNKIEKIEEANIFSLNCKWLYIIFQLPLIWLSEKEMLSYPSWNHHLTVVEGCGCPNDPRSYIVRDCLLLVWSSKANWS